MKPAIHPPQPQRHLRLPYMAVGVLILVALVYWPLHQAFFVWDDKILIHDNAWLSVGSGWRSVVFHGIQDWRYFRPLGLALFVAEIRWFGIAPGPMHLVSLTLQLVNTAMVGALAWRLCARQGSDAASKLLTCGAMLAYGLHPALIEPTSWIACQFDLLVTLFMLLGLLLNLTLRHTSVRALLVATCFFIAACAKESAIAFPVLLVLLDSLELDPLPAASNSVASGRCDYFRLPMRRQWPVYLSVFLAGIVYLIFREWGRAGHGVDDSWEPYHFWERLQIVSFSYMVYWRMIVWPFVGLCPQHIIPLTRFAITSLDTLATDMAAIIVGLAGLLLAWRRKRLGILIVGVTATLFPVLHVIPISFDESLYHERYAMPAIAWACILVPGILASTRVPLISKSLATGTLIAVAGLWLILATLTIRSTVPLWFNDSLNWRWALKGNPDSIFVMDNLLATDLANSDYVDGAAIAKIMMSKPEGRSCVSCMLNVANLSVIQGDLPAATKALKNADSAFTQSTPTHTGVIAYILLNGELHMFNHDLAGAEAAYRDAISIDPMRADGYIALSSLLASQGKSTEARKAFDKAMSLSAPDVVNARRARFEKQLAAGIRHPYH